MWREKEAKTACIRRYVNGGQLRASLWVFPTNFVDRNRCDRHRRNDERIAILIKFNNLSRPMKTKLKESAEKYAARSQFCSLKLLPFIFSFPFW